MLMRLRGNISKTFSNPKGIATLLFRDVNTTILMSHRGNNVSYLGNMALRLYLKIQLQETTAATAYLSLPT